MRAVSTVRRAQKRLLPVFFSVFTLFCTVAVAEHDPSEPPKQVIVSVKIIEFQITKGVETGLSAFFLRTAKALPFGQVSALNMADLTFPTSSAAGITVFLDRIGIKEGQFEFILQALVDENRAFILSKPRAMVMVGETTPTIIQTTQQIPYENTVVVGSTAVQVTAFEDTGVTLEIMVPEIIDDDGDWTTRDDTYVRLDIKASVKEEGQRIVVALDDQLAGGSNFSLARNAISVPEFISRRIDTHVWVRNGQVLMLGGLYRNSETKSNSTLPWLTQGENAVFGAVNRVVPGNIKARPLTSTLGSRSRSEGRRELVFMIKSEIWWPAYTVAGDAGLRGPRSPSEADSVNEETPE